MSIVAMNKKLKAKQNISSKETGFSLKGTIRNIRGIGGNLQSSEVRTIFKGTSPTGYGGLPSRDTKNRIKLVSITNDFTSNILSNNTTQTTIESTPTSAMTTKGLLLSKVYHPTQSANNYLDNSGCNKDGECPTWWVKDFNPLSKTQSEYIRKIKVGCSDTSDEDNTSTDNQPDPCQTAYYLGTRKILKSTYHNTSSSGAITSGEFTSTNLLRNNCLPTPPCKKPFPFILNKNGCNTEYLTPLEAQLAGELPADWNTCSATSSIYTKNPYIIPV
jgi:hypothetical protein